LYGSVAEPAAAKLPESSYNAHPPAAVLKIPVVFQSSAAKPRAVL
jgi:hypothetical protein